MKRQIILFTLTENFDLELKFRFGITPIFFSLFFLFWGKGSYYIGVSWKSSTFLIIIIMVFLLVSVDVSPSEDFILKLFVQTF